MLKQSFPRLGSLLRCERAHVLVVRTYNRACKHLASVHPHVEKVPPHESCFSYVMRTAQAGQVNYAWACQLKHIYVSYIIP